jgi:hypothetical protein
MQKSRNILEVNKGVGADFRSHQIESASWQASILLV